MENNIEAAQVRAAAAQEAARLEEAVAQEAAGLEEARLVAAARPPAATLEAAQAEIVAKHEKRVAQAKPPELLEQELLSYFKNVPKDLDLDELIAELITELKGNSDYYLQYFKENPFLIIIYYLEKKHKETKYTDDFLLYYEEQIDKELAGLNNKLHNSLIKFVQNDTDLPYKWNKILQDEAYNSTFNTNVANGVYKSQSQSHIEACKAAAECEDNNFKSWYDPAFIKNIRYKELRLKLIELKRTYYRLYVNYLLSKHKLTVLPNSQILSFISLNISEEGEYITDDVEINDIVMYMISECMKLENVIIEFSKSIKETEYINDELNYLRTLPHVVNLQQIYDLIQYKLDLEPTEPLPDYVSKIKVDMKLDVMINILKELGLIIKHPNELRKDLVKLIGEDNLLRNDLVERIGEDHLLRDYVSKLIMDMKLEEIINILKELNVIPIDETSQNLRDYVRQLIMNDEETEDYKLFFL